MNVTCRQCGEVLPDRRRLDRVYCSDRCRDRARRSRERLHRLEQDQQRPSAEGRWPRDIEAVLAEAASQGRGAALVRRLLRENGERFVRDWPTADRLFGQLWTGLLEPEQRQLGRGGLQRLLEVGEE